MLCALTGIGRTVEPRAVAVAEQQLVAGVRAALPAAIAIRAPHPDGVVAVEPRPLDLDFGAGFGLPARGERRRE